MLKPMFEILTVTSMHRKCSETSSGVEPLQYKSQLSRKNSTSLYRLPARLSTSSWEEPQPNCDLNFTYIYIYIYIYIISNFFNVFHSEFFIFIQNYQNMLMLSVIFQTYCHGVNMVSFYSKQLTTHNRSCFLTFLFGCKLNDDDWMDSEQGGVASIRHEWDTHKHTNTPMTINMHNHRWHSMSGWREQMCVCVCRYLRAALLPKQSIMLQIWLEG